MGIPKRRESFDLHAHQLNILWLITLVGCFAFVLMIWITVKGPGVSPDSVIYLDTAQSLISGHGFFANGKPLTHFPPAYPILLAVVGIFFHGNILHAARFLSAFFYGANIILLGIALYLCTKQSFSAVACVMSFFLTSAPVISTHAYAMSEAPFISFTLVAFILLSQYVIRPRFGLLLAISLCAGWAMLIRYVGITLLPPVIFALLIFGEKPARQKVKDALLATALASLPLASWIIRNLLITETASNRNLELHIFNTGHAIQLVNTIHRLFFPVDMPDSAFMRALPLGVAGLIFLKSIVILRRKNYIKRNANNPGIVLPTVCMLFFFAYISFLVISISLFDAHTPLDARILLPASLAMAIAGVSLLWSLSSVLNSRLVWVSFTLLVLFLSIHNGRRAFAVALNLHQDGIGYNSRQWKDSETIESVKSLPEDMKIYSNGHEVIQFRVGRPVDMIPLDTDPTTRKPNRNLGKQLQALCREVMEGKAIVVYLEKFTHRWYLPTLKELRGKCRLPVLVRLEDGAIFGR